jgi:prepilin-type N-terminal cleavage/methylation domain-containing protein
MRTLRSKLKKTMKDERGVTLIEVLAALMITGMVASILYSFLLMGVTMYKKVSVETQLRNQANVLFSKLVNELRESVYVLKTDDLDHKQIVLAKNSHSSSNYIKRSTIEFVNDTLNTESLEHYHILISGLEADDRGVNGAILSVDKKYRMVGSFRVVQTDLIEVNIDFFGEPIKTGSDIGVKFSIHQQIPLFRME